MIKKLKSSKKLQNLATKISSLDAEAIEVIDAGREVFMLMYGGSSSESLGKLR